MTIYDATEAAYKNGYNAAKAEYQKEIDRLGLYIKSLVQGRISDVCSICIYDNFTKNPLDCITCNDIIKNGNFKLKTINNNE